MSTFEQRTGRGRKVDATAVKAPDPKEKLKNAKAEDAVIGAILKDNDRFDLVSDFLQDHHFSESPSRLDMEGNTGRTRLWRPGICNAPASQVLSQGRP